MTEDFLEQIRAVVRDRDVRVRPRMSLLQTLEELGEDEARAELRARLEASYRRIREQTDALIRTVRG